jgi:hypothetical protein
MFKNLNYKKITKFIKQASVFLIVALVIFVPIITSAGQPNNTNSNVDTIAKPDLDSGMMSLLGVNKILSFIAQTALWLSSLLLTLSGILFEQSIKYGIQGFAALADGTSMVTTGWVIARDLSNIMFIFLVLWVGISTILGLNHGSTMGSIMKIAIAAILINFSLFLAKAVIDVANVIALHFYDLLVGGTDSGGTLVGVFMKGLQMQGIYDPSAFKILDTSKIIMIGLFGSIMIIVASWIFISGAVLMLYRTISLIILMIMSPFAFISWVVPEMHDRTHDWWHKLFHQAFFAPIFMAMAYIVGKIIQTPGSLIGQSTQTISKSLEILSGGAGTTTTAMLLSAVGVFFNFLIVIGLLIACLHVAEHSGAKGAETMMHWGEHLGGMATGFVGTGLVNMRVSRSIGSIRDLNEKFGESKLSKSRLGSFIKSSTTGYLAEKATFGGHHTAEDIHKENLEFSAERKEIAHEEEAVELTKRREQVIKAEDAKLATAQNEIAQLQESLKQPGANVTQIEGEIKVKMAELEELSQSRVEAIKREDGEIQRILSKLSPESIKKMSKETLFNEGIMRNLSLSQFAAVFTAKDRLTEEERERAGEARYGHILKADKALKGPLEEFEKKQAEYIEKMKLVFDLAEKDLGGVDPENEADVKVAIDYAIQKGIITEKPKEPKRPSIQTIDPTVRNWLRGMKAKEMDYIYRLFPDLAKSKDFCSTVRQGAIDYAKNQSESIPQVDSDGMREGKSFTIGDGIYFSAGIGGDKKPSLETMTKIFVDFKLTDLAKAQTQEFQDYLKNMPEQEWQDKKNTVIRKAIDNMMTDGTYTDYVNNLNAEQKVMRMMGGNKIKSGLGGKAPEEVAKMRGWMWMNSDISKRLNRSLTAKFSDKDNEEKAKIVMHKLNAMEDYLKFLVTNGQSGKEISKEDFDTLIWMVNDRTGKLFPTREDLKPHLQPIFDDLQTALSKQEVSLLDDKQALTAQLSSMLNKMQVQNSAGKRYGQT